MLSPDKSLLLSLRNVAETLAISAPTVLDATRGRVSRQVCDDRLARWADRVVRNAKITVTVRGREHLDPARAHVVMSNHQSHYDVPVLYSVLGPRVRMVAKKELFELPVFGRAMREAGFISVDRRNTRSAIASLDRAKEALREGTPIWIAPEGTRSPTGELLRFKKGGFLLALEAGAPVLPVTIRGTRAVLRARGVRSRRGAEVEVTIHPPVATAGLRGKQDRDMLMAAVRSSIASALGAS